MLSYFAALRRFTKLDDAKREKYLRRPHRDFTRHSPLSFRRTVSLILDLARQSLAVELGRFFAWEPQQIVTKSAFCQRRKAIHPYFFRDLFELTAQSFYRYFPDHKRWKGKRLFAVDGTGQSLPREPWIGEHFGFHQNQHTRRPSTRLLLTHDLLNNIIYRVNLHGQDCAEIIPAYQNVDTLPTDAIYIYDRHFASFALAYLHHRAGSNYVIRMRENAATVVRRFVQSAEKQQIVHVTANTG